MQKPKAKRPQKRPISQPRSNGLVPIAAIIAIVAIEAMALACGINGTLLKIALVSVAGIGGWHMKGLFTRP